MKKNQVKVIIFPDIHGRTFWKEAVNRFPAELYPDVKIIFLGDYLDPYVEYDGISKEQAFDNFKEILEYANNDSRVNLLIGNHDWHYFVLLDKCRIDKAREREIENLFVENLSKFSLTKTIELDGCKYLFSHAGITNGWLNCVRSGAQYLIEHWNDGGVDRNTDPKYQWLLSLEDITKTHNMELFEQSLTNYNDTFYTGPISMISRERGGYEPYGSLIWADVYEHIIYGKDLKGYYQIFGHTYAYPSTDKYIISPNGRSFAMLDCGKTFVLDNEGNIEELVND